MTFHIMWFREDLRLADNPAFTAACKNAAVVPLYILDDGTPDEWRMGGASRWWLHHSLKALSGSLSAMGLNLVLMRGDARTALREAIHATGASAVHWNRCYEPFSIARDSSIKKMLKAENIAVHSHTGSLLAEPWEIKNSSGDCFKVFTPFWKTLRKQAEHFRSPLPVPEAQPYASSMQGERLERLELLPSTPDWAGGLRQRWQPGEEGAASRLRKFLERAINLYAEERDFPALEATSDLSPHLHFGEISPQRIWHAVQHAQASVSAPGAEKFLSELAWREFSYHLLYHFPELPRTPFNTSFRAFPWREDTALLHAWQRGKTGYPLVDAGMRELWHTGTLHNRIRMVTASFLTKHLLIHWREGARWFWDTLVDADLANNSASWQWVAGCGADAAPYFRIFNPVLQSRKYDPEGLYLRRWIPEIARLPTPHIHAPWEAPEALLRQAGIVLGRDYPVPVVDHATARHRALEAFKSLKKET